MINNSIYELYQRSFEGTARRKYRLAHRNWNKAVNEQTAKHYHDLISKYYKQAMSCLR